jgi:membrane-bound lytic murein transglycosylase A
VASLTHFRDILFEVRSPVELNEAIARDFEVYQSAGYDGRGTVFFTGYYTPIFDGRRQRDGQFRFPLYALPPDLVKDDQGTTLGRRMPDGTFAPYETRRQIEEGRLLAGTEIAWLRDPFEAYIVTVQGSAKLRLPDGSLLELGYAGNNGYPYTPVGQLLVDDGHIHANDLSLQSMIAFFSAHPEQLSEYCWRNDRTAFFREVPGGPFGSLNVPVTAWRTIATDKAVFPRACIAFLETAMPRKFPDGVRETPYAGFALDQDTGGAIRAAGRCDLYMGVGAEAESLAGRAQAEGKLYYIFLRRPLMPQIARAVD